MKLNLETKTNSQELVKQYLEENVSEILAEKINNDVRIEKDGKTLLSKKTLDGFMQYACDEARKQAEKGSSSACIEDSVVFGWAVHYFEEDSIEGTLYTEDGKEYKKPVPKTPAPKQTPPKPQPKPQMSMFDLLDEPAQNTPSEECEDDEPTEEEIQEILAELAEEEKKTVQEPKPAGSPLYRNYQDIQRKYPDSVVIYRLGDFYEVFGDNAVRLAKELDLTLTGRDCGLKERVPMIGFPYHAADNYINRLTEKGYKLAVCETPDDVRAIEKRPQEQIDEETGEILSEAQMREFDGDIEEPDLSEDEPDLDLSAFHTKALAVLDELFGNEITLR